jgi:SAM-dependent methyltransferase
MLIQFLLDTLAATIARPLVSKHRDPSLRDPMTRNEFVASVPVDKPVLEIGPFDRPWLSGSEVRYFDVLPQEQLKVRAATEPRRNPNNCPQIHYVSPTGDLSVVGEEFSAVFSSHCIEHQPDLIKHLREVGRLLRPGGDYYLIVPDKRFCFDHFLPESRHSEIVSAKGRTHHTEGKIDEHTLAITHNNNLLHWLGIHGQARGENRAAQLLNEDSQRRARAGEYVDVHAWQFTPSSFRENIQSLYDDGEINLEPRRVHNTGFAKIEFMAVLTRTER